MKRDLSSMSYEDLKYYLVICYFACDHEESSAIRYEMRTRFPEKYYEDMERD